MLYPFIPILNYAPTSHYHGMCGVGWDVFGFEWGAGTEIVRRYAAAEM